MGKEYYCEQPWLALPYEARDIKDALSKKYKVSGIPSVVILSPEGKLITKDGRSALSKGKTVALYFSAHWCGPCRQFTPKLAEWYTKDLKAKGMEVIFVSS